MSTPLIVTTALVGTARQENADIVTGTPVDTLVSTLSAGEFERQFLLQAGAWAIYRQGGRMTEHIEEVPESAPDESLPACPLVVAVLLHRLLLGEHKNLLPEALEYLRMERLRIPFDLLPLALAVRAKSLQSAVFPVLGERGMWLSQFNPEWAWVKNFLPASANALPYEAEITWHEGTTGQRCEVLRRLRSIDPTQAREWLEDAWKQEKAEVRLELLSTLEVGLSEEDEPFLEKVLDDRAASVNAAVPPLLARIPASAFARRMLGRADAIVTSKQGKLRLKLPTTIDKAWQRDGIIEKPQASLGECSWWLIQILAYIPLTHWEEQFKVSPIELIEMANTDKFGNSIIEGWSRAAQLFDAELWIEPLWDWWQGQQRKKTLGGTTTSDMRGTLMKHMTGRLTERKIQQMMVNHLLPENADWEALLSEVPTPWSREFGDTYLQTLQQHVALLKLKTKNYYPYTDSWFSSLEKAATQLPSSCFTVALEVGLLAEGNEWQTEQWHQQLQEFTETLRVRQHLLEEIMK